MASAVPAWIVAGRVHIWVEDQLTRAYHQAIWPLAPFHILVAGGREAATAMARRAAEERAPVPVFAVVDRDLGRDNEARWGDPTWTEVVYRPAVLEVENFLLDEVALAEAEGNAAQLSAAQISHLLRERAAHLRWWMICKRALAELNALRHQPFPRDWLAHPDRGPAPVASEEDVVALICGSTWARHTLPELAAALEAPQVRARVQQAHGEVQRWLDGEGWRERFSGKELFTWVAGQVSSGPRGTRTASVEALAAEVGAIQARTRRAPAALGALEASIRRRAGL